MEEGQFSEWFNAMFLPATADLRKSGPVVLFFDGHGSHIGIDIVTKARKENVILQCPTNRLSGRPGQPKTFTDN